MHVFFCPLILSISVKYFEHISVLISQVSKIFCKRVIVEQGANYCSMIVLSFLQLLIIKKLKLFFKNLLLVILYSSSFVN